MPRAIKTHAVAHSPALTYPPGEIHQNWGMVSHLCLYNSLLYSPSTICLCGPVRAPTSRQTILVGYTFQTVIIHVRLLLCMCKGGMATKQGVATLFYYARCVATWSESGPWSVQSYSTQHVSLSVSHNQPVKQQNGIGKTICYLVCK